MADFGVEVLCYGKVKISPSLEAAPREKRPCT